ncbi:MAG TPA: EamA family transporter [Mycobacteriales bacterium]|nr:EamA family transporter [Mycobacteriales bacterium]
MPQTPRPVSAARLWLALWTVYLVWGSTYLAIRFAVAPTHGRGLPPLLMAGVRFTSAGAVMLALTARRPAPDGLPDRLGRRQWLATAVVGTALLLGGNGFVTLAEQHIASGATAVVIATVPIWTTVFAALRGWERITRRIGSGLLLGFAGVATLVVGQGGGRVGPFGVGLTLIAALTWALGSVYAKTAPLPRRPLVLTGMEMLCGGAALLVVAALTGEIGQFHPGAVPVSAWASLAYLIVAGAMIGYTAYAWLLANARLSLATTYAYVNPLVAVFLGALLAGEPLTWRTAVATGCIIGGVLLIVTRRAQVSGATAGQSETAELATRPT